MSEPISDAEFRARFIDHFIKRMDCSEADAQAYWEACTIAEHREGFEDDPEGAADEEISYFGDGE